jgi:aryl-phospho-beta-D-glucosidase BglC (GH1 family)
MSDQAGKKMCPKCRTEVDAKATKCPHCQSDLRNWFRQHPIGTLILVLIFVPIFVSQIIAEPTPTLSPAEQAIQDIKEDKFQSARILAKSYIDKVPLTSPSTAKYNPPTTKVDPQNPNLFEVSSYIDSQNGFGAMVRTYWSMKLEFVGKDDKASIETDGNWKIKEFIFDGEKIK